MRTGERVDEGPEAAGDEMKILCIIKHKWTKWRVMSLDSRKDERHCTRCGVRQERRVV